MVGTWLLLAILLSALAGLLGSLIKKRTLGKIAVFAVIFGFLIYSYCSTTGSARLAIALMGHPIDAYRTGFAYGDYHNDNIYLSPTVDIQVTSGSMLYLECKSYGPIKISHYYGF